MINLSGFIVNKWLTVCHYLKNSLNSLRQETKEKHFLKTRTHANTNRHPERCRSSNLTQWRAITVCTEAASSEEMEADGDGTLERGRKRCREKERQRC